MLTELPAPCFLASALQSGHRCSVLIDVHRLAAFHRGGAGPVATLVLPLVEVERQLSGERDRLVPFSSHVTETSCAPGTVSSAR